jgi:hypothetical protein
MIHVVTAETLLLLESYCSDRELRKIALNIHRRRASRKIHRAPRSGSLSERQPASPPDGLTDFSDVKSQRVLAAASMAVARELGRQAARDYFAELLNTPRIDT